MDNTSFSFERNDLAVLRSELTAEYKNLITATDSGFSLQNTLATEQETLKAQRDMILLRNADDPKALGANEATRDAALRAQTGTQQTRVDEVQQLVTWNSQRQALSRLQIENLRAQLRTAECRAILFAAESKGEH